jgi:hypothetical protein
LNPRDLTGIGMAWLYALHVRSSLARGRMRQAEEMLSSMRDQLPREVTEALDAGLAGTQDAAELARAFDATLGALAREVEQEDVALARRLTPTLMLLASAHPNPS